MIVRSFSCFFVLICAVGWCNCVHIGDLCPISNQHISGNCAIKENCTEYMKLYTSTINNDNINFLLSIQCDNRDFEGETIVCCPRAGSTYENPRVFIDLDALPEEAEDGVNDRVDVSDSSAEDDASVLPGPNVCGVEAVQNRIFGGDFTTLTEFPWMALLVYNDSGAENLGCAASLISRRYVLTAAHCVSGTRDRINGELQKIRFGEFNTQTEKDCVAFGSRKVCADPIVEVGYEKIVVHTNYLRNSRHRLHDIALIRLDQNVNYTRYIRPICLPIDGQTGGLEAGQRLTVAGWGRTDLFYSRFGYTKSPVKLKLKLPIIPRKQCKDQYNASSIQLGAGQVCAGGVDGQDSCSADSGGPLMHFDSDKASYVLCGIVSFGATNCGTGNLPGVYTDVEHYTDWIIENLEK